MNNKLDQTLIDTLGLSTIPLAEKISLIEDQINNIDKIKERLDFLLNTYSEQRKTLNINEWHKQCSAILSGRINLTMENNIEFGFNFRFRNRLFRCCISYDDNETPYWGIYGRNDDINSCPRIFESLRKLVLQSNKGFHNNEYNSKEWVISDYEMNEIIVERFITLSQLICDSETCIIAE